MSDLPPLPPGATLDRSRLATARDFRNFYGREPPRAWYGTVVEGQGKPYAMAMVCLGLEFDTAAMIRYRYLYTPSARPAAA